ncbi:hypothetical protein E4U02_15185 [Microbacterium paludicola]|uniref:Uncharacterized protein n=1 Tax=Microbacterium paludicola TaxID=300019 RepID=A0A4Y9FLD3_9MICO|nr:hypothetical protein [Microbacterium paludicola]MBF0817748.1 hypothetical protein [Microbacterium paludicola]TFU29997.1 hypothetical protein E4U02_15185 [Microbacterium paludicola]
MTKKITQYPAGGPDWATIAAWADAGRPDIPNDGTWRSPRCTGCGEKIAEDDDAIGTSRGPFHNDCAIAEQHEESRSSPPVCW